MSSPSLHTEPWLGGKDKQINLPEAHGHSSLYMYIGLLRATQKYPIHEWIGSTGMTKPRLQRLFLATIKTAATLRLAMVR